MKLKVYAALSEDINNGWVWLPQNVVAARNVVKIFYPTTGKTLFCEALSIGFNFKKRYNEQAKYKIKDPNSAIIINEWYRHKLGILKTQEIENLEISPFDNWWGKLRAALHHPQTAVRLATTLGIISVALGIVALFK